MKYRILELFQKYDFYDFIVSKMNFDFTGKSLEIEFLICDDILDKYVPLQLRFCGVNKFVSNNSDTLAFVVSGCYSAECKSTSKNRYEVFFVFMIRENGRDIPAWELTIGFSDLESIGGLSEEALAYKYEFA